MNPSSEFDNYINLKLHLKSTEGKDLLGKYIGSLLKRNILSSKVTTSYVKLSGLAQFSLIAFLTMELCIMNLN